MALGSVNFTAPQDTELLAIERRRRMAEMLAQQAGQPTQVPTNAPISPLSGLAKALRGYTAGSGLRKADEQEQQYNQSYQQELAKVLQGDPTGMADRAGQSQDPRMMALAAQLRIREAERQAETQQKAVTNLTDEEEKAAGLNPAGVYQKDAYGGIKPVWEPPKPPMPDMPMDPELYRQKMAIATAGNSEFGVTPQIVKKPDGWYERLYSKSGNVTERKLEGEPVRGMQYDPNLQSELAQKKQEGKDTGVAASELADRKAAMPRLQQVVTKLGELGKIATYTGTGVVSNTIKRQLGLKVGDAAEARAAYIAMIDNEVLPLLRQTFGAQFTQKEGESLKVTLGDPNKSPEEKQAVLDAFIESKMAAIETGERRVGGDIGGDWSIEEVE